MQGLISFRTSVLAGIGTVAETGKRLSEMGCRSCAIVSGERTMGIAGSKVAQSLEREGVATEVISGDIRATLGEARELEARVRSLMPDTLVAVGGGRICDLGKWVAHRLGTRLVAVPTTLSSDAFSTGYSVLWDGERNTPVRTKPPDVIVGDYDILIHEPKRFVLAGLGDMMSKVTALFDWRLAFWLAGERYSDYGANIARSTVDLLTRRLENIAKMNYNGIETLFLSEVTDGYLMEISGTTRVAAGSEHLFAFALENMGAEGMHGEFCALGTVLMSYLQDPGRDVRSLFERAGMQVTAEALGIKKEQVVGALTRAHRMRPWYTIMGRDGLSEGAAERLARYTRVI